MVLSSAYYQETELVDGKAPTGAEVEWIEEESYFFKLSAFEDKLLDLYKNNPNFVYPNARLNEVKSFVEGGLKDLSISRTNFDWGVDVPNTEGHVMYVWIDALTNYLTSIGFPDENANEYTNFWKDTQGREAVHVVGKDILRFHAVYWPAFLMAAEIALPDRIIAHGWWTIEGEKMSKSIGNVIAPVELVENYGLDQTRYFLLKAMPFGNDGDLSKERLVEVCNADLANNIGNLAQRSLSMIQKNFDGKVPNYNGINNASTGINEDDEAVLLDAPEREILEYKNNLNAFKYKEAIENLTALASATNEYFNEQAPWGLKENPERMGEVLYSTIETIRIIAILLQPFCPDASKKLLDQLAVPNGERNFENLTKDFKLKFGTDLPTPQGIFPRLEVKDFGDVQEI